MYLLDKLVINNKIQTNMNNKSGDYILICGTWLKFMLVKLVECLINVSPHINGTLNY